MLANKNFRKYTIAICFLGFMCLFFYSGLSNDHINVLTPILTAQGWSNAEINNPVTVGATVTIIFYLICGVLLAKKGPAFVMVPSIFILGLSTLFLGFSVNTSYAFYSVCMFLTRLLVVPIQMGSYMLCSNWFIKYRGRVLGIITMGCPFFSIAGLAGLTKLVNVLGLGKGYAVFGAVVLVVAVLLLVTIKDTPEQVGLNPDGSLTPTHDVDESTELSVKEVLADPKAWQLTISYGILQFVIVAMMAFMAARYIGLGGPELWTRAMVYLSIGSALGIPMSYIIGWVDDKVGSIKASLLLCVLYLFCVIPLLCMPEGGNSALMLTWAFGVACMTGGEPTMHPSITTYVYGRKKYQAANKWIMTLQAIIQAFVMPYMNYFYDNGNPRGAYIGILIMLAVAFVTLLTMLKIPDANLADREYANKAK